MKLQLEKSGLEIFFKPWQVMVLKYLEAHPEGSTSRVVCNSINDSIRISRASVINFLEDMADAGYLHRRYETGKGGRHGIYRLKKSIDILLTSLLEDTVKRLAEEFPSKREYMLRALEA